MPSRAEKQPTKGNRIMRRKNNFLEQLRARQEAARSKPATGEEVLAQLGSLVREFEEAAKPEQGAA
jgi:hypothetical protein